jgi:hypothetical protein
MDVFETAKTVGDADRSGAEKIVKVGLTLLGAVTIGGGATKADNVVEGAVKLGERIVEGLEGAFKLGGNARASSRALGRALESAGTARPAGSAAHHLVAGSAERAAPARAILRRFDIGINDAANGAFLPVNPHRTLHTNDYYDSVNSALGQATTRAEALEALTAIRESLAP